jgi:hypothetical protein
MSSRNVTLDIQDDEVVPRSDWGLLDADDPETDNEEGPSYRFGKPTSESQLGGPEDIDVQIPEERTNNTKHNCKC